VDCCNVAHHEITVQAGASTLTLMRCGHCSQQAWTIDGVAVEREEAFAHLSGAYRDVPASARAARERTQAEREQRRAQREAAAAPDQEIRLTDEPEQRDVSKLLEGWQVLGAVS
jgi:hypothetical protein